MVHFCCILTTFIIRPHRMHLVNAACCYKRHAFHGFCACASVSLCVAYYSNSEPCKNGRTDRYAVSVWTCEAQGLCIRYGGIPHQKGYFRGHVWACQGFPAVDMLSVIHKKSSDAPSRCHYRSNLLVSVIAANRRLCSIGRSHAAINFS